MGGALAEPRSDFETESIMSAINTSPSYWIGKISCSLMETQEGNIVIFIVYQDCHNLLISLI